MNSALIRPDIFLRLTFLGGQGGPPASSFPFNIANGAPLPRPNYTNTELDAAYAQLNPPRRAYGNYWASKEADYDMKHIPAGMTMSSFFRAFYYMKSHDFPGNQNLKPLHAVQTAKEAAEQDAIIPEYYVMRRDRTMRPPWPPICRPEVHRQLQVVYTGRMRCVWSGIYALRLDRRAAQLPARLLPAPAWR